MPGTVMIVAVALMLPPPLLALIVSWIAAKKREEDETSWVFSFRTGAWVTVFCSMVYFGFLALLAGINAAKDSGSLGALFYVGLPVALVIFLTVICFGWYWAMHRVFRRIRNN